MAVYAAHLTRTLQGSPSIFEVVAQESLASTVKPAFRKVIEVLAQVSPRKFNWLVNWYDEVYLVLNGALQYHYLKHFAATFAECFYGLQRVPLSKQEFTDGFHLSPKLELLSFLSTVLFPYIRGKLEDLAEKYRLYDGDGLLGKTWKDECKRLYLRFYTTLHTSFELAVLANYLMYLSGAARAHSPLMYAAGCNLTYSSNINDSQEYSWRDLWNDCKRFDFSESQLHFGMLGTALLQCMEYGAFFVQFLKWWESSNQKIASLSNLPLDAPPEKDANHEKLKNKCPVCLQSWRIPTVLPVSGFIYCFRCITRCLKENGGVCPVTGYPAKPEDLVRVYLND